MSARAPVFFVVSITMRGVVDDGDVVECRIEVWIGFDERLPARRVVFVR
jgi:hypothetical protein